MVLVDNKWNTEDYNHCGEHDIYYKKYCHRCVLQIRKDEDLGKEHD